MLLGRVGRFVHGRTGFDGLLVEFGTVIVTKSDRVEGGLAATAATAAGRAAGRGFGLLQEGCRCDLIESLKRRIGAVVIEVDRTVEVIDNDLFADRHRLEGNLAFAAARKHSPFTLTEAKSKSPSATPSAMTTSPFTVTFSR